MQMRHKIVAYSGEPFDLGECNEVEVVLVADLARRYGIYNRSMRDWITNHRIPTFMVWLPNGKRVSGVTQEDADKIEKLRAGTSRPS